MTLFTIRNPEACKAKTEARKIKAAERGARLQARRNELRAKLGWPPVTGTSEERKAERQASKAALQTYRAGHPLEQQMNRARTLRPWPKAEYGETADGPVKGSRAELFDANARKAWTGTRLAGNAVGAATLGMVPTFSGRKKLGAAAINVYYADGTAKTYPVAPEALSSANAYVVAFNAYSAQLERED